MVQGSRGKGVESVVLLFGRFKYDVAAYQMNFFIKVSAGFANVKYLNLLHSLLLNVGFDGTGGIGKTTNTNNCCCSDSCFAYTVNSILGFEINGKMLATLHLSMSKVEMLVAFHSLSAFSITKFSCPMYFAALCKWKKQRNGFSLIAAACNKWFFRNPQQPRRCKKHWDSYGDALAIHEAKGQNQWMALSGFCFKYDAFGA
ncbi:hypothetical protein VNO77_33945 [Canavalia gladiata]|uniref:Uncharacterized protein n=1 Tax=Canavalia gladiata TaxID=3824 RepID=A0AAN9KGQ1_CANGL